MKVLEPKLFLWLRLFSVLFPKDSDLCCFLGRFSMMALIILYLCVFLYVLPE